MSTHYARPKWWQLYLTLPFLIVLFILDTRLGISERGHQMVHLGIILLVYGLVHLWLKANATALSKMDQRQFHRTVIVTRLPAYQLPEPKTDNRPMFQFTNLEIKGTLSDTFERDYIDAESISVDEIPQESNKE